MFKKILFIFLIPVYAFAINEVYEPEKIRENFGLNAYISSNKIKDIKIAILDNGFLGFQKDKKFLPPTAELIELTQIPQSPTSHGLAMAQIVWALTGKSELGPKFFLINTNGFSNLKAATEFVINQKVDFVLYSQTWPFGSNFDGTGFINALVTRVTQNGIIWINAVGNSGGMVYNGWVQKQQNPTNEWLQFDQKDYLRFENKLDENNVTVTLSWTDFQESESYNTTKDLDLFIYNDKDVLVGSSELIQKGEAPKPGETSKLSSHAREVAQLNALDRGNYKIKIMVKSKNFESKDRFRVLLKSEKETIFTDKSIGGEIMPPADNPNVISVGFLNPISATGPTFDGRKKPEILLSDARVGFTNGEQVQGTSSAAALLTGVLAVLKSEAPNLNDKNLKKYISLLGQVEAQPDLIPGSLGTLSTWVKSFITLDIMANIVVMRHRLQNYDVVLIPVDPLDIPAIKNAGAYKILPDDIIVASPSNQRWYTFPQAQSRQIKPPLVEFRKANMGQGIWKTPTPEQLRVLFQ